MSHETPRRIRCLSWGWVPGVPWRCPSESLAVIPATHPHTWRRVIRVGKSNAILMVPNDWSTLVNGTVGGKPTGLHRYVGEQRFAFALLNVTDGAGNVVSFDLESRGYDGAYRDRSNPFIEGCPSGA